MRIKKPAFSKKAGFLVIASPYALNQIVFARSAVCDEAIPAKLGMRLLRKERSQ